VQFNQNNALDMNANLDGFRPFGIRTEQAVNFSTASMGKKHQYFIGFSIKTVCNLRTQSGHLSRHILPASRFSFQKSFPRYSHFLY
jgi:hypothetical protein